MLVLTLAVLLPVYAVVAGWAYRTGGVRRLWAAGLASVALIAVLSSFIAMKTVRGSPLRGAVYLTLHHGIPVLTATLAAALARGRVGAALAGGVVGLGVVLAGVLYLLSKLQ